MNPFFSGGQANLRARAAGGALLAAVKAYRFHNEMVLFKLKNDCLKRTCSI